MELEAAKVIGAGLAVIGVIGSGIGIGNIFSSFIQAVGRNPARGGCAARSPATGPGDRRGTGVRAGGAPGGLDDRLHRVP